MRVLLFDIDGTLISTGGAGMASLLAAMREEFGVAEPQEVPVSGRTDRGIARSLFDCHDIEHSEENWRRFRDAYLKHLRSLLPQRPGRVLPGVTQLLGVVSQHERVLVGLLTGNLRAGATLKLAHYGLVDHFAFGGFGDHHADRDAVAAEALSASQTHAASRGAAPREVWVIGDTPLDVKCARAIGARAVAVATGGSSSAELAASQPDVLVEDLTDLERLLEAWELLD